MGGAFLDVSIAKLSQATSGQPQYTLEPEVATQLFSRIVQSGILPWNLVEQFGPPPPRWPFIHRTLAQVYAMYSAPEEEWPTKKRRRQYRKKETQEGDAAEADDTQEA